MYKYLKEHIYNDPARLEPGSSLKLTVIRISFHKSTQKVMMLVLLVVRSSLKYNIIHSTCPIDARLGYHNFLRLTFSSRFSQITTHNRSPQSTESQSLGHVWAPDPPDHKGSLISSVTSWLKSSPNEAFPIETHHMPK